MKITRKSRYEVWPEGAVAYTSQHNDLVEAVEAAYALPPGVHQIRINGALAYEVSSPAVIFNRVAEGIVATNISVMVNGAERQIKLEVSPGDAVEFSFSGRLIGSITV
jgi:hypothetical protein